MHLDAAHHADNRGPSGEDGVAFSRGSGDDENAGHERGYTLRSTAMIQVVNCLVGASALTCKR